MYQWDIRDAKALWGAWHGEAQAEMAFKELQRRSLVDVGRTHDVGLLHIHDVVRSLGIGILRHPARAPCFYGSRLWSGGGIESRNWSQVRALQRPGAFATVSVVANTRSTRRSNVCRWWLLQWRIQKRRGHNCTT
jgi:hypothetical protein